MISPKDKIDGERRLHENAKQYKKIHGVEACFTLTPAGAKELKTYLAEKKVKFTPVTGMDWNQNPTGKYYDGVPMDIVGDFLAEKMGLEIPKNSLGTRTMSKLLGAASTGVYLEGDKNHMVILDLAALDALAKSNSHTR